MVATENITLATIEGSGLNNLVVNVTDTTIQFNYNCTITTVSVSTPATSKSNNDIFFTQLLQQLAEHYSDYFSPYFHVVTSLCVALVPNGGSLAGCISEIVITVIVIVIIVIVIVVRILQFRVVIRVCGKPGMLERLEQAKIRSLKWQYGSWVCAL